MTMRKGKIKYKKISVGGLYAYVRVESKRNRPAFPKPAIYKSKKNYDRNREKANLRHMLSED